MIPSFLKDAQAEPFISIMFTTSLIGGSPRPDFALTPQNADLPRSRPLPH